MILFSTVVKNIRLLRWRYGGHENLAHRLEGVVSSTMLSDRANGKGDFTDEEKRAIESKLRLPTGWFDRDNIGLVDLQPSDFALVAKVLACKPAAREALHAFLLASSPEI